jgi:nucleolar protein 15
VLPKAEVHPELFKGADRRFKNVPWKKLEAERHNKPRTPEEHAKRVARALQRDAKRKQRIEAAGIDYEYEGLEKQLRAPAKKTKFSD